MGGGELPPGENPGFLLLFGRKIRAAGGGRGEKQRDSGILVSCTTHGGGSSPHSLTHSQRERMCVGVCVHVCVTFKHQTPRRSLVS